MPLMRGVRRKLVLGLIVLAGWMPAASAWAQQTYDTSRYMAPSEIKRGMKGFGRTVVEGTRIDTFDFEVLSVMHNAFDAAQDVILVRCSGLNLEHSGIVAGMSGSPCYIRDAQGRPRLIGAVAFGWSMSKDPICGVQPITQMLDIPDVRDPDRRPPPEPATPSAESTTVPPGGIRIDKLVRVGTGPIPEASRFSALVPTRPAKPGPPPSPTHEGLHHMLQPLRIPVAVSGMDEETLGMLRPLLDRQGLMLVGGGSGAEDQASAGSVTLEPGAVLSIPMMSGDLNIDALGTCTDVIGDKVLGFGHGLFSRGFVELPLATGVVYTVFPSLFQSFKVGASVATVGTIFGDEQTGVFGVQGRKPPLTPLEVTVRNIRGTRTYHYELARDMELTPNLIASGVTASVYNRSDLPEEHTVRYSIRIDFGQMGTFQTSNFTSQVGTAGLAGDLLVPLMTLLHTPFGRAKVTQAAVDVTVESGARRAMIHQARLLRTVYRPGETVTVSIQWLHDQRKPTYTLAQYDLTLPADLPEGDYELLVGSAGAHVSALQAERPHEWYARNFEDVLAILNLVGSFPENRLYMHLKLPETGIAVGRTPMPELPSFWQQILADTGRSDIQRFTEALVVEHETDFAVSGSRTLTLHVSRKQAY